MQINSNLGNTPKEVAPAPRLTLEDYLNTKAAPVSATLTEEQKAAYYYQEEEYLEALKMSGL